MEKVLVENKAVAKEDTVVKFGLAQITKTTPEIATKIFRVVLYIAAIGNIILDLFPEIPFDTKALIAMYSIKAVAAVHAFSKLFGLDVKSPS